MDVIKNYFQYVVRGVHLGLVDNEVGLAQEETGQEVHLGQVRNEGVQILLTEKDRGARLDLA